ncbi:Transmembrane component NikQ of energizing module of nickel ECF transporter [Olavius sp. associated proteobacterium Delta 1]|nr:Transmembrane component NikQ of energizing module of nickel ECF transporter [Olavius sp. associated proteobacterium Delta 1]
MLQEPFADGNSLIHQLDPRIRLVSACVYSTVVALSLSFSVLTTAVLISFICVMLAQLPAREIIKRIIALNSFNVLLWIVLPLTFQGPIARTLGPFTFYNAGFIMAAQITLKSNSIFLIFMSLVTTMNLSVLGYALNWLHVPDKIVHLLLMTYRYVFLIEQEYQRLIRAARFRGFRPGTNLHTYKTYAAIVGMLLVRSAVRADRVHNAMLCRGFKRKFYCLHEFNTGKQEWLFATAMAGITVVLIYFEWL